MPYYFLARARAEVAELLSRQGYTLELSEVRDTDLEVQADLAVPMFRIAKERKANPVALAGELARALDLAGTSFASASALKGYLNFRFDPTRFSCAVVADFARSPDQYGSAVHGSGRTIVIDYSSPNIAKPFSVGHLRSTIIGQALKNIFEFLGYRVISDNHLGDWGTQFGKLLCAFHLWGVESELERNPTQHLLDLYVRYHREAKENPKLELQARDWFRRLETGEAQVHQLWERFVSLSTAEFNRIYDLLGIRFDETLGESFYSNRLDEIVRRVLNRGIGRREKPQSGATAASDEIAPDETVVVIPLDSASIDTPMFLQRSDGTSLYATREIACAEYRIETWHPERILYVVGNEQEFYFRQFAAALELLGHDVPCIHVNFGLIRLPTGRMSTREGKVVLLEDVIKEAIQRASAVVADRDIPEAEKKRIARTVGIGAIKYADLSQTRTKEVVFNWDKMLALDGDSAPYLQYANTRTRSILRRSGEPGISAASVDCSLLTAPEELSLLKQIARFPDSIAAAADSYEPHRIANRLYDLARAFSVFYDRVPVLKSDTDELRRARLLLVEMTGTVLKTGLGLLGIEVTEQM